MGLPSFFSKREQMVPNDYWEVSRGGSVYEA